MSYFESERQTESGCWNCIFQKIENFVAFACQKWCDEENMANCHCSGICERFIIQRLRWEFLPSFWRFATIVQINTKWFVNFLLCRSQHGLGHFGHQQQLTKFTYTLYAVRNSFCLAFVGVFLNKSYEEKTASLHVWMAQIGGNAPAYFTELFICSCNFMKRKIDRTKHSQHLLFLLPRGASVFMLYGGESSAPENRCVGISELKCNSHGCVSAQKNKWKIVRPTTSHSGINLPERFLRCGARRYDFQQSHNP